MHADNLRQAYREAATASLHSLVMACRRRFLNAAALLEWRSHVLEQLRQFGVETRVDVWPLMSAFSLLGERYISAFYSPQRALIPGFEDEPDEKWWKYFHHVLVPHLLANDEVVRNVLRAVGAFPCRDPQEAARVLAHYLNEMTLPESRPAWAPENSIDE